MRLNQGKKFVAAVFVSMVVGMMSSLAKEQQQDGYYEHGVLFNIKEFSLEQIPVELTGIKAKGYNQIELSSWAWSDISAGSEERQKYELVLNWCDEHDLIVWVLHNVQFGSDPKYDRAFADLKAIQPRMENWARLVKGHACVRGLLLGNEVSPGKIFDKAYEWSEKSPMLMEGFRHYLIQQHGTLSMLNKRWGTQFKSFDEIELPSVDRAGTWSPSYVEKERLLEKRQHMNIIEDPAFVDALRYSRMQMARYYDTIIEQYFYPILGDSVDYASKEGKGNPFTQREVDGYTVAGWDGIVLKTAPHVLQILMDTVQSAAGRPVFDCEMHLHHDEHQYKGTPESINYILKRDYVFGERLMSSYNWHGWTKPETKALHEVSSGVLSEMPSALPLLNELLKSREQADLKVLVTEFNIGWSRWGDVPDRPANGEAVLAYGYVGALGRPWQYLLTYDLKTVTPGETIIVASRALTRKTLLQLADLPASCQIVIVGQSVPTDDWGMPHRKKDMDALMTRSAVVKSWGNLAEVVRPADNLPSAMTKVVPIKCWSFNKYFTQFQYTVPTPELELRYAKDETGRTIMAVINHSDSESVTSELPWNDVKFSPIWTKGLTKVKDNTYRFDPETVALFVSE